MKILLTGGTGFLGRHIHTALHLAGHEVRAVSRSSGADFNTLVTPAAWLPLLDGVDAVINGVGIIGETRNQSFAVLHSAAPLALFQASAGKGIRRVIQISALGADDQAASRFHLSKRAADDFLRGLDLDWFVLRPSLVVGGHSTRWLRRFANLPVLVLPDGGAQIIQPVAVRDVTGCVLKCLENGVSARRTLDVVGPQAMPFRDFLVMLRRSSFPQAPLIVAAPPRCLGLFARLLAPFHAFFNPDNLAMLQRGVVGEVEPLTAFLGRTPYPIDPNFMENCHELSAP